MATIKSKYSANVLTRNVHPVIVFLCTPRCGTQWFAKNLSAVYPDKATTLYEPIENDYKLKVNLGIHDISSKKENAKLNKHFIFIEKEMQHKNYIEVGWQSIAGLAEFHSRFGDRLRLIHLYRNPVNVAASLVTHNWYTGNPKERVKKSELSPFDVGAILKGYKSRWEGLKPFEKSLYYWTEINLRALEIKYRYPRIPFYSLKFENLFQENIGQSRLTLFEVLSFMELNYDYKMLKAVDVRHDDYQYKSLHKIYWKTLFEHPQTIALANKLGYEFDEKMDLSRYKNRSLLQRFIQKNKSIFTK